MKRVSILAALTALALVPAFAAANVEPAIPVRTVPPEYPAELKQEGVSGLVVISFTVNDRGEVVDPTIEKSSRPEFDRPALTAIKRWKFKPARENGTPVARKVTLPIQFSPTAN